MSAQKDRWNSPAWSFQSKPDARLDLLGVASAWGTGGMGSADVFGPWTGDIYYVDNGGSNTNLGTTPDSPFLTITKALSMVTDGNNDVIVVLSYGSTSRASETWPIAITSSHDNVSIIGVPYGNIGSNAIYPASATTAAFTITGAYQVKLVNLNIGGYASGDYGVYFDSGTAWRCSIIGCHFGTSGTTDWGIYVASDPPQLLVEGCDFHSGLTEGGIYISNCTRGDIIGNSFHVNSGDRGIQFSTSQADFGKIMGNTFFVMDAAHGEAVYCSGQMAGGIEVLAHNTAVKQGPTSSQYTFDFEPYWWGGSTAPGVGYGPNVPDPTAPYQRLRGPKEKGKMLFVSNSGSNTYDGTTPAMAKLTLTAALALCTTQKGDMVVVVDYYSTSRAAETFPIDITKDNVTIYGIRTGGVVDNAIYPGSDVDGIRLDAQKVDIYNLNVGGGGATRAGIHMGEETASGGALWRNGIHGCHFGVSGTSGYGILGSATNGVDHPYLLIEDCEFANGTSVAGIQFNHNAYYCDIRNCRFDVATGNYGVYAAASCVLGYIHDNMFKVADAADGEAITLISGATTRLVNNNWAGADGDGHTNNPYQDTGTAGTWGTNWESADTADNTLKLPA